MRAAILARAFATDGFAVDLVSGGMPVPGLDLGGARLHQLSPARSRDESFSELVDAAGAVVGNAWHAARAQQLLSLLADVAPDIVLIEMYPFGRRALASELSALVAAARARTPRPVIVSSVRDILQVPRKPGRAAETASILARDFDLVLVHGDPAVIRLEESFPLPEPQRRLLSYTGYVAPAPTPARRHETGEVLVSAGGGAVGRALAAAALSARPLSRLAQAPWRLLLGTNADPAEVASLAAEAPDNVTVEGARRDFPSLLGECRLSVSQAGYNTVMDILNARARAVLVPFEGQGETEQTMRAERFAARGLAHILAQARLSPAALAAAIDAADAAPAPALHGVDLGGAAASVRLIRAALARRRPEAASRG